MKMNGFLNAKRLFSALMIIAVLVCGLCFSTSAEDASSLEIGYTNLKYSTNTHIIVTLDGDVAEGYEKGIAVWNFDVEGELTIDNVSFTNFEKEYDPKGVEFFSTFGIPASELSEELSIAPAIKDGDGNITIAGGIVKCSAFDYVEARISDGNLKGYQIDLYRDLIVYGTVAEQVLGDKIANNNVVVAKNGYVGKTLFPFVIEDGETEMLRALAVNAKGEYFSHWEDMNGDFVSGERIVTVDVNDGLNYYNAVYGDKADSAYSYFADFQGFESGEYEFTVGALTDAQKTNGKAIKFLPLFPNNVGTLIGFRKMMTFDPAQLEGLSATDKIPTIANDSLSFESVYDGTKYLNYVKNATASYGYDVGSIFDTSSRADQTAYDRVEMDVSIPHSNAPFPTMYFRFISSAGTTADIIINLGRSTVDGVACFRLIYQTESGNKSLYVPDNGGTDVVSFAIDINENGVCNIYLNGEKATLEAPIARLNGSYVAIPAGTYNPVSFRFENSTGYNYNYKIYSLGLVDTDKIKTN